jgi:hypothetical protein
VFEDVGDAAQACGHVAAERQHVELGHASAQAALDVDLVQLK